MLGGDQRIRKRDAAVDGVVEARLAAEARRVLERLLKLPNLGEQIDGVSRELDHGRSVGRIRIHAWVSL